MSFKEYEKIKVATIHNTRILLWPLIFLQTYARKVNSIHRKNVENLLPHRNGIKLLRSIFIFYFISVKYPFDHRAIALSLSSSSSN